MAKIIAPVKGYTGKVVGVHFRDGVGSTKDASALAYFARHGYTVTLTEAEIKAAAAEKRTAEEAAKTEQSDPANTGDEKTAQSPAATPSA